MSEDKEQMRKEEFINKYLGFKNSCVNKKMINIEEIIKLFEVFISS